jgi:hypothetical protein
MTTHERSDMLPTDKPSKRALREQSKLPGKLKLREPKGDEIGPRQIERTGRKRAR